MNSVEQVTYNLEEIRASFPILDQEVNGYPLIYFDNAATTQKPKQVIDSLVSYYSESNSNIHRGIHTLAEKATSAFEETREALQRFVGAGEKEEIIFTRGTSESLNLVASSLGRQLLQPGDRILITGMEHHSNIVPWQLIAEQTGAEVVASRVLEDGSVDIEDFNAKLTKGTKIVAMVYASNALGVINPVKQMIASAKEKGAITVVDGAQAAAHLDIDVKDLGCDFFALSAHKMYGPTGVGALFGKRQILEAIPPYQGGGEMIAHVSIEKTTYADIPYKFEAGTPNIADVVAWKAAIDFIEQIGKHVIRKHESELVAYANDCLHTVSGLRIYGDVVNKVSVVSFTLEGMHHFDAGMLLDSKGIAVRTGHHCTQPLMDRYGIEGTIRASLGLYNSREEIDTMVGVLKELTTRS